MIRLAPGANPKNALQTVTGAATKLANVLGAGSVLDQYNNYLDWASQQANLLSTQLHPDELDRLITTRRYWSFLSLDTTSSVHHAGRACSWRGEPAHSRPRGS